MVAAEDVLVRGKKAAVVGVEKVSITEIDVLRPTGTQVVVKITHSGVCRSDVHAYAHIGPVQWVPFPLYPGHEILGKVFAHGPDVGEEAKELSVGEKVVVYPWISCENCPRCASGDFNWCLAMGNRTIGGATNPECGYSEYVTVPHPKFLVPSAGVDDDLAAILPCAGLTAYSAVKESQARERSTSDGVLVVIGCGGLGLLGIQFAKKLSKQTVVAVDVISDARKAAKEHGADFVVNPKETEDVAKFIRELAVSNTVVEAVIDFVNTPVTHKLAGSLCVRGTHVVVVGAAGGGNSDTNLLLFPIQAIQYTGVFTGSLPDLRELVALIARDGDIKSNVTKHLKLEDVGVALKDLKEGKVTGRQLLVQEE